MVKIALPVHGKEYVQQAYAEEIALQPSNERRWRCTGTCSAVRPIEYGFTQFGCGYRGGGQILDVVVLAVQELRSTGNDSILQEGDPSL